MVNFLGGNRHGLFIAAIGIIGSVLSKFFFIAFHVFFIEIRGRYAYVRVIFVDVFFVNNAFALIVGTSTFIKLVRWGINIQLPRRSKHNHNEPHASHDRKGSKGPCGTRDGVGTRTVIDRIGIELHNITALEEIECFVRAVRQTMDTRVQPSCQCIHGSNI